MSKHTPGPWEVVSVHGCAMGVGVKIPFVAGAHVMVASTRNNGSKPKDEPRIKANAERIAACVNGCEGIDPSAVCNLLAACEKAGREHVHGKSVEMCAFAEIELQLRDAIAKAKGGAA